jgi:hypothetical protein
MKDALDSGTTARLRKQSELLVKIYRAELAKDPKSQATESSRSNAIAVLHTVRQLYGEAIAREAACLTMLLKESPDCGVH